MKQIIKLQKEQLKAICKGVGIKYREPKNWGMAVDKLSKEDEESEQYMSERENEFFKFGELERAEL